MRMPSLHKKVIISLVLAVIVIGGSVYLRFFKDKVSLDPGQQTNSNGLIAENNPADAKNFLRSDADNDGLKYWEEALWGTDPNKADTDGDGTPDGKEVKEGRSPTLAGPNDRLKIVVAPDSADTAGTSTGVSLTDAIAKSLYANYAVLGQSDALTPENQTKLTTELSNSVSKIVEPKSYTENDIKIAPSETPSLVKQYGNDIAISVADIIKQESASNAVYLSSYLSKGSPAELQKIVDSSDDHKKTIKSLLILSVPKSAKEEHLALLNGVSYFGRIVEGMSMIDTDPIVTLVSAKNYNNGVEKVKAALRGFYLYFADEKIVFTKEDRGYIFSGSI